MKLRLTYGVPIVALVLIGGVIPSRSQADEPSPTLLDVTQSPPTAATLARLATATGEALRIASSTEIVAPPASAAPSPVAPGSQPSRRPAVPANAAHRTSQSRLASLADAVLRADRQRLADIGGSERKIVQVKVVGPCQIGQAAWYGGRYVGRRTTSGELLDSVHATAAHRNLPLNSLVRVTNLNNGRSVIVRITDRGPVSESLLIDVSPRAADELAMKQAGIVRVAVEQVVELPSAAR
jgi:rare lipoprotein A (peptidoglycan hydrolase)